MEHWNEGDSSPGPSQVQASQSFRRASLIAAQLADDALIRKPRSALKRQSSTLASPRLSAWATSEGARSDPADAAETTPRPKRSESAFASLRRASMAAVQSLNPLADRPLLNSAFDAFEEEIAACAPSDTLPQAAHTIEASTDDYAPLPDPKTMAVENGANESDFFGAAGWFSTILPSSLTPTTPPKREPEVVATLRQVDPA